MKNEQRELVKNRLNATAPTYRDSASMRIAEKLIASEAFRKAECVFVYKSFGKEVQTDRIIEEAQKSGKRVCLPRIEGEDMLCLDIRTVNGFFVNEYGITEPIGGVIAEPDLIIMPLLAFDKNRKRLGRGKGFYDRFCKDSKAYLIALAYEAQRLDEVDADVWDVKPNMIVTEEEIYL